MTWTVYVVNTEGDEMEPYKAGMQWKDSTDQIWEIIKTDYMPIEESEHTRLTFLCKLINTDKKQTTANYTPELLKTFTKLKPSEYINSE